MFGMPWAEVVVYIGLLVAILQLITAGITWNSNSIARDTNRNMAIVEKATNSMKDALVAATATASFAEGEKAATIMGERKAATLAAGQLVASVKSTPPR